MFDDDIYMLKSLQRLLHTLKFEYNEPISYSLHSAMWSNTIIDRIITYYLQNNEIETAEGWKTWRKLTKRKDEYNLIVNKLIEFKEKAKSNNIELTCEKNLQTLRIVCSPFTLDETLENELIKLFD